MSRSHEPRPLESSESLADLLERSAARPQLIFKHSLYCGLSGVAFEELQAHLDRPDPSVDYWLVTVQTGRAVSDEVEERLGVRHESPQALLVMDGKVVWNASHRRVTAASLAEAISGIGGPAPA
jgi:bacillithiol system protein YtxJ